MQERRRHSRYPIELDVIVNGPGVEAVPGIGSDLSIGGMFLQAPVTLAFGAQITLDLTLPGMGKTTIPAVVRWVKPDGMGLQFGLLGARQTHALTSLLRAMRGDQ